MSDQPARRAYPKDVSDEEWAFVAPYLCLSEDCGQRKYRLREVFNGLRYVVWAGGPWRGLPHDLPPWEMAYQPGQRWIKAGVFEALCHDLRVLVRLTQGRDPEPSVAIFDGRTVRRTPESGGRAGYDGYKKTNGSKTHVAADTRYTGWPCTSRPPTSRNATRSACWQKRCRKSRAKTCNWPGRTKVTPDPRRSRPPPRTASS